MSPQKLIMEEIVMAYKAVSTSVSHIAHAGYKEDWQGKWHGSDGTYQVKPEWAKADQGRTSGPSSGGNARYSYEEYSKSSTSSSSGNSSSSSESTSGPVNPTRKDPYTMTNEQLKEDYTRAQLIANYNKYYPSKSEEYVKAANNTKQLISDGGAFVKKVMPDKIYVPLDLSGMSDEELRAANNRAQLEYQYNQYFNPPKQNKSKEWIDVAVTGANLLISASAVAAPIIISAVKAKKGGGN